MEKFTSKTVQTVFNGTTDVELVSAPPAGVAFNIQSVTVHNTSGGTKTYTVMFDKGGTQTNYLALALLTAGTFTFPFSLASALGPIRDWCVLSASDETLAVKSSAADTSSVIATFSIIEAEIV